MINGLTRYYSDIKAIHGLCGTNVAGCCQASLLWSSYSVLVNPNMAAPCVMYCSSSCLD